MQDVGHPVIQLMVLLYQLLIAHSVRYQCRLTWYVGADDCICMCAGMWVSEVKVRGPGGGGSAPAPI